MNTQSILIKPLVTEKSMNDVTLGKYTFAVANDASKTLIKKAISAAFNVNVVSIATRVVKGKTKRVGMKRTEKTVSAWKKATVKLKKGEKISLFEPGEEKKK